MKPEDKKLLLQDLCARLPYGVICTHEDWPSDIYKKLLKVMPFTKNPYCIELDNGEYMPTAYMIDEIKPYLRPMSSMTEEEAVELGKLIGKASYNMMRNVDFHDLRLLLEFIYKKHLDYNHLIEKDLALEANKDMYK